MLDTLSHFIAGKLEQSESGEFVENRSPATGAVIGRVANGTSADVNRAVEAAVAALPGWRDQKPIGRGRVMQEIARNIRARIAELAAAEAADTGMPLVQARGQMETAAAYFEFYGGLVNLPHGETIDLGPSYHSYTRREPFGVVGVILPWNAPVNQAARAIAPALAAGNTVVAKPSEETSTSAIRLAQLATESGLPAGVLNVVLGVGAGVGAAVVEHPKVRKVSFTGSVRAGREVGKIAAERIIPLTLELGGKSPNIIFDDADLTSAVPSTLRGFAGNAGQICVAGTRLLVQKSIKDEFLAKLKEAAEALKLGPVADAFFGPMITRAQYDKVLNYFDIAQQEGAKLVTGGKALSNDAVGDGWYVQPTIYEVRPEMRIASEEIFGPVLSVIPFDDEEDAIRIANDTEYGLAAGIHTQNLSRAHRVAARLEAGQVYINEYLAGGIETPFGGFKQSGYGREKGIEALHHYTQLKCVTVRL
ncbi:Betaine-aldehyde dehydrogenase [Sphingobium chlorophenolicum L-1]|uniref:Betaine-aldehyde dehydrogenase n=1 Tax=Sphingobium chlorophenolicum L-1 TaxID=690566 RepID=F6EW96_SPHCR|nr:aldehyde dehydrogenase family protein [Sphingobium chlorophenolicum]AEG49790.1 Betaine-aldehyde dehydrogenase [Sphingobium chlorophenolicum L-1]